MIRSDFTRQLKQFLSGKSSQVWLIYGISGIGKSHILDLISKESARQSFGHLLFNKTDRKQDTIFSESLLRQASILGESISDTKAKQPIKFIKLCKKLQNISPLEQLEAGTSTSDPITFIAKIALLAPKFFGFYNYRQHPEKALFGALSGHLENKPLILLFDNFISSTSIKTKLKGVSKDGAAQWGYESSYTTEPFHSWLEKLIRYLSFKKHPVFVVVSGCNPLQTLSTMDLGLETKIYHCQLPHR